MMVVQYDHDQRSGTLRARRRTMHRALKDDVDDATKQRRLAEVIEVFRESVQQQNFKSEMGKLR